MLKLIFLFYICQVENPQQTNTTFKQNKMKQTLFKLLVLISFGTFATLFLGLLLSLENFIYNF